MKAALLVTIVLFSLLSVGQAVHVSSTKNGTVLSVSAAKPYDLVAADEKLAILSVDCAHKGKKSMHLVTFSPGGMLADDNTDLSAKGGQVTLPMTIEGTMMPTSWAQYGTPDMYAYLGQTEPERLAFIQALLKSEKVSITFKPFLTGIPVTSDFDLTKLPAEMAKHPECALQ